MDALRLVVPPPEIRDALDQLPGDLAGLPAARERPRHPVTSREDLVQLVAERSGPAAEDAGRMTEGVLEVLAERLPDAEVDALAQ
jgi:Uncharacterized conserved protein (DUF2267)